MEIVLPPFDEAELSADERRRVDTEKLRGSPYVAVVEPTPPEPDESDVPLAIALLPLVVFGVPIWAIAGAFVGSGSYWWIGAAAILAVSVLMAVAFKIAEKRRESPGAMGAWLARSKGWGTQQLYLSANNTSRAKTLDVLRAYGIRTATDLVTAFKESAKRQRDGKLDDVLPTRSNGAGDRPSRIQVMYDVIRDEEWMPNLIRWHSREALHPPALQIEARPAAARATLPPEAVPVPA